MKYFNKNFWRMTIGFVFIILLALLTVYLLDVATRSGYAL